MIWYTVRPNERKSHYWFVSVKDSLIMNNTHWMTSYCGMRRHQNYLVPSDNEVNRCKRCQSILEKEGQS